MKVGYLGLGAMGGTLARRLAGSRDLVVWDVDARAVGEMAALGATAASSAADLARRCDIILLCLPRSSIVRAAIFGPAGLAEGLVPGKIVVDQTSGVPGETAAIAERLATKGVGMIDAPVSGGVAAAAAGGVTVIGSGPEAVWIEARPILAEMSTKVFRCGDRVGDGQALKLVNNAIGAGYRMATLEIVALGRKLGLSLRAMTEAFNDGAGGNFTTRNMLPAILEGRPATNFALSLMIKDLNEALALGLETRAPMPVTAMARGLMQIGLNTMGPAARLDDVIRLVEDMAGVRLADEAAADPARWPEGMTEAELLRVVDAAVHACNQLALYECLAVGVRFGLDLGAMATILNAGSAASTASERILPALASQACAANPPLEPAVESLRVLTRLAATAGAPLLVASVANASFEAARNEFGAGADLSVLGALQERMANARLRAA